MGSLMMQQEDFNKARQYYAEAISNMQANLIRLDLHDDDLELDSNI